MKPKLKTWLVGMLAAAAAVASTSALGTGEAEAQQFPPQPVIYSGTVTVSSGQDPTGLFITARVLDYESEPVEIVNGAYSALIVVLPDNTYANQTVTFHLDGVQAEETDTSVAPGLPIIKSDFNLIFPKLLPTPLPLRVATISDGIALSDTIIFSLTGVTVPAGNTVYEGWLVSDDGSIRLSTGILTVSADGSLSHTFSSPTGENFIANYDKVVITVEPVPDGDPGPSDDVVFMDQIPASGMAHIRHLLTEWPPGADAGILTNLKDQIQVAVAHANLAKNSSTIDGVKLHIHHVINIIEGEGGLNFDASFGNPGDGIGVLTHAQDRKHASFARNSAPGDAVIAEHSELVEAYGENAENWSILARDQALSILDLDSLVGAQALSGAVGAILQDARAGIDATGEGGADQAYVEAQLMATYTLAPCGDLNGDGDVNVFDAIIDLQIIVGLIAPTEPQLILGDVVRDGTINVLDAILVLQHIVGLTVITDCGPEPIAAADTSLAPWPSLPLAIDEHVFVSRS